MTPPQKPGRSRQDCETPAAFMAAVRAMLGIDRFDIDLAAAPENAKAVTWITPEQDALTVPWAARAAAAGRWPAFAWVNPPFARLGPWVEKCAWESHEQGLRIAALLPAGVGTEWFAKHVAGKAHVLFLRPRLTFVGETAPYPKDLVLCLYDGPRVGYSTWDWKGGLR